MTEPKKSVTSHFTDALRIIEGAGDALWDNAKEVANDTVQTVKDFGKNLADEAAAHMKAAAQKYGEDCYKVAKADGYTEDQALAIGRFSAKYYLSSPKAETPKTGPGATPQA